jgi:starch phosphorylase
MEYGLSERLTIYSGGLGVLAGDFLRSAHALGLPLIGVGIAWGEGYTQQTIAPDGTPRDLDVALDRRLLTREEVSVDVTIAGQAVPLSIWRVDRFENAPLYLLEPTKPSDRRLTRRLYGGDEDDRIAQEIILGVGGVRALAALGIRVDLHHFNEGHAVFAGLELIRRAREHGHNFESAWELARDQIVFTTHTPVDEGNEKHDIGRLQRLGATAGFSSTEIERLGGRPFNMTVAGLRLATRANAVAALHGVTARKMWAHVADGAPIDAITNGVDHRVWQDERIRNAVETETLYEAHRAVKRDLLEEVRRRTGRQMDPSILTIGFARRATSYKRATLLFRDRDQARALLASGRVHLIFAGKAHPRDVGGKALISEIVALTREFPGKVVFLENYDLALGRLLTRGCDVWLNTPRRPLEACGTSGMKAAMNGVLNLSILDGWWVEGCQHGENGWRIGDGKEVKSEAEADKRDAAALHQLLADDVLPMFYGHPDRWTSMMRSSIRMAMERFSADRMVREYFDRLYRPERRRRAALA